MISRRSWFYFLLITSLTSIGIATVFPLNFVLPESLSFQVIIKQFHYATNIKDYVRNILLFIPWGIGLAGTINAKKYHYRQIII